MAFFQKPVRARRHNIPTLSRETGVSAPKINYLIRRGEIPSYDEHRAYSLKLFSTIKKYLKSEYVVK